MSIGRNNFFFSGIFIKARNIFPSADMYLAVFLVTWPKEAVSVVLVLT